MPGVRMCSACLPVRTIKGPATTISRRVALGEANYDYVEVVSGIEPGEQVVISDMSDYAKQPELKIKPAKRKR